MRLDYTLYILAALLLIVAIVPIVAPIGVETTESRSIWVIASVVLGLLSIGLGYSQRPKTEAQACQPSIPTAQKTLLETQPITTEEESEGEKTEAPIKTSALEKALTQATPIVPKISLTQVKGIGEKRATQLKSLGINNVDDLARVSAKKVAKKLKISPKTVDKWVTSAKELVE